MKTFQEWKLEKAKQAEDEENASRLAFIELQKIGQGITIFYATKNHIRIGQTLPLGVVLAAELGPKLIIRTKDLETFSLECYSAVQDSKPNNVYDNLDLNKMYELVETAFG